MQWEKEYSIGIDEIDHQHQTLLGYMRLLAEAIDNGGRWTDIHFPLVQLREFAQNHFALEESLMRMSDYTGTADHIEGHRKILKSLTDLEKMSLEKNITNEDARFMQQWLIGHIMKTDRDYAEHFANGGRIVVRPK